MSRHRYTLNIFFQIDWKRYPESWGPKVKQAGVWRKEKWQVVSKMQDHFLMLVTFFFFLWTGLTLLPELWDGPERQCSGRRKLLHLQTLHAQEDWTAVRCQNSQQEVRANQYSLCSVCKVGLCIGRNMTIRSTIQGAVTWYSAIYGDTIGSMICWVVLRSLNVGEQSA